MVLALDDPDAVPRLSTPTFACVLALVLVIWLLARIHVVRLQRSKGQEPTTRIGFLHRLAAWPPAYPVLGLLACVLAAIAWFLR